MNMTEIRQLAKDRGAKIGNMTKADAVRAIQMAEGNNSCFATSMAGVCGQDICLFRIDCVKADTKSN